MIFCFVRTCCRIKHFCGCTHAVFASTERFYSSGPCQAQIVEIFLVRGIPAGVSPWIQYVLAIAMERKIQLQKIQEIFSKIVKIFCLGYPCTMGEESLILPAYGSKECFIFSRGVRGVHISDIKWRMQIPCSIFDLSLSKWHKCAFSFYFSLLLEGFFKDNFSYRQKLSTKPIYLQVISGCTMPWDHWRYPVAQRLKFQTTHSGIYKNTISTISRISWTPYNQKLPVENKYKGFVLNFCL